MRPGTCLVSLCCLDAFDTHARPSGEDPAEGWLSLKAHYGPFKVAAVKQQESVRESR